MTRADLLGATSAYAAVRFLAERDRLTTRVASGTYSIVFDPPLLVRAGSELVVRVQGDGRRSTLEAILDGVVVQTSSVKL